MATPTVSVIIPVYNNRQYISKSIESVLAQSLRDFEVIVVDDFSSDGSQEIVRRYKDAVTLLCHEVNQGVSVARNTGTAASRGRFIAYLDGDDLWAPNKLELFLQAFEEHGHGALFGFSDFNRFKWDTGQFYALSNTQLHPEIYRLMKPQLYKGTKSFSLSQQDVFPLLLDGYPIYPSTVMVSRDLLGFVGDWNPNFRRNQDFDFALRAISVSDFIYIDERLTNIGRHEGNKSADTLKHQAGDLQVLAHHLSIGGYSTGDRKLLQFYQGKRLCGMGYNHFERGERQLARRYYRDGMKIKSWFLHALIRYLLSYVRRPRVCDGRQPEASIGAAPH